jgi:hypothetical protein
MSYNAGTGAWTFAAGASFNGSVNILGAFPSLNISGNKVGGNSWALQSNDTNGRLVFIDTTNAGNIALEIVPTATGPVNIYRPLVTSSGVTGKVSVVTDTVNLDASYETVVCNKGTAMSVNLPAVASSTGRKYTIKNKGAGVVTVDGNGAELIDNAATQALNQWQSLRIVSDGAIWVIV